VQAYQTLTGSRVSKPTGMSAWSTFMQTYDLLQEWMTPKQIARKRDLWIGTIYNHLARLHTSGKELEISKYITDEKITLVAQAMQAVTYKGKLKPLYDYIWWSVSYDELRLGISVVERG
jgi:ATP-dependent DNA helicase RecQ